MADSACSQAVSGNGVAGWNMEGPRPVAVASSASKSAMYRGTGYLLHTCLEGGWGYGCSECLGVIIIIILLLISEVNHGSDD